MTTPRSKILFLSLPLVLASFAACATRSPAVVPVETYRADIAWLADDAREGRDTGSAGLEETEAWVSRQFEEAGLQPLGDEGGWLQHFTVAGQQQLTDGNSLRLGDGTLDLKRDWIPLQSALRGSVEGDVVFAGYGITDVEGGYDDYAGLDVKGKIVLALRRGPKSNVEGSRYALDGPGRDLLSFASKVNTAFRAGAAALVVVNGPADYELGSREDRPMRYTSLGIDAATASLPAAHVSAKAAAPLLAAHGLELAAAQAEIDTSGAPHSRPLPGLTAALRIEAEQQQIEAANVLGMLPGSDPALAGEYVIVGAHMDHVGLGTNRGSRGGSEARGQIHNGADDNASGTAGVVAIARMLAADADSLRRTVVFATWSAEEWGLLGSQHFVDHPPLPLERLVAAINMDMIGRSQDGHVAIEGVGSSPGFQSLVERTQGALGLGLDVAFAQRASDNSDQASFYRRDIPVLNFFTGLHDDYHKPSDDIEKINAEAGAKIATLAGRVARELAAADRRPEFTGPPEEDDVTSAHTARATASGSARDGAPPQAYRVVLGTQPDMSYQKDDGVRLSGVRPGTPGEKAGLQKGDLITAFDDVPVRTLGDYASLLFAHKPGDTVKVTIVRGEQILELTAVLEGQAGDS